MLGIQADEEAAAAEAGVDVTDRIIARIPRAVGIA
jgi:hypothetical protein